MYNADTQNMIHRKNAMLGLYL